jgi:hypothetical protein
MGPAWLLHRLVFELRGQQRLLLLVLPCLDHLRQAGQVRCHAGDACGLLLLQLPPLPRRQLLLVVG